MTLRSVKRTSSPPEIPRHREHEGRGIGTALTEHALAALRADGMTLAVIETGGDPGHAAARRIYERACAVLMPIARYFAVLGHDEDSTE